MPTTEQVPFRMIECPECRHLICWVNPRLPTYCPECGKHIYMKVRESVRVFDRHATLKYTVLMP